MEPGSQVEQPTYNADAIFQHGVSRHAQGAVMEAERAYRAVLQLDPNHFGATLALALMYAEAQRREEATALVNRAMSATPNTAPANSCLGDVLTALQRYDEATVYYNAALRLDGEYVEAHCGLGNVLHTLQRYDQAVARFEHALRVRPDFAEGHNNLGNALLALRRHEEAQAHYQAALAIRPDFAEAYNNLGNALQGMHRYEESLPLYQRALALKPGYPEAHNNLGNALQALHRYEEAVPHYQRALSIWPNFAEAHNNLGTTLRGLERYGDALTHFQAALGIRPNYAEAYVNLGNVMSALHRYEEAVRYYRTAMSLNPDDAVAHNNLGSALDELEQTDDALIHHQAAVRIDPGNKQIHQAIATFYLKHGRAAKAAEHGRLGFGSGIEPQPYHGAASPLSVLVLESALGGNVRTGDWLDSQTFLKWAITAEFCDPAVELPPHHLAINAIGEADRSRPALLAAQALLAKSGALVINRPELVLATSRMENARRLAALEDVVSPRVASWPREFLMTAEAPAALAAAGFEFPLLVRAPGFHTGEHFLKVDGQAGLTEAAARLPSGDALVIEFANLAGPDGNIRKFRVMTVDGQLLPLHLAISKRWMVHFLSADMGDHAEHRAEDALFLGDMAGYLGPRVMAALERVQRLIGLDYGGIDFSLDAQGRVVVFEANATMVAPFPDAADARFAYRRPAVERVHSAVRAMILSRARASLAAPA
jgi:tetratricopeptide (TPR) repeat protein